MLGYIRCRFVPGSQTIRDLGLYLRDCESDKHSPYFIVQEKYRDRFSELVFSRGIIDNMMRNGNFHMQQLKFKISSHHASSEILICLKDRGRLFPISGFPRILQQEDATRGTLLSDLLRNDHCSFVKQLKRTNLSTLRDLSQWLDSQKCTRVYVICFSPLFSLSIFCIECPTLGQAYFMRRVRPWPRSIKFRKSHSLVGFIDCLVVTARLISSHLFSRTAAWQQYFQMAHAFSANQSRSVVRSYIV